MKKLISYLDPVKGDMFDIALSGALLCLKGASEGDALPSTVA
jgi:hypothetical protein